MSKFGLALSGGGFRASLYHLGLARFLRDAGILPHVTHITSVSGGSIFAAHLVLNWDRYNGSPSEFDAAAAEFLSFMRLDVRNRIARRYPLALPLLLPLGLLGRSIRKMTRTGLLEHHYEKYLYRDTSLFELPEKPQLHLLATNLSEGCLCSFNRSGLLMVRRGPGNTLRMDHVHIGLGTVAMAVTASSAFPGFFPPLELTGQDVGASSGEFGRQSYTDGGVFDNLGVRMFRCLQRPLMAETPLCREDLIDLPAVVEALRTASKSGEESPLRRLAQILVVACSRPDAVLTANGGGSRMAGLHPSALPGQPVGLPQLPFSAENGSADGEELLVSSLWHAMRHCQFQADPQFAGLRPADQEAESLCSLSRYGGRLLDGADQLWLNRHLLEAAFQQATGKPCFRRLNSVLDCVLVSDVGKPMAVEASRRAGGLIRTALRASSILMDRVWQLEKETFQYSPGFVFAPITDVVEPGQDPTALHPEVQRQTANIRTDLDRFSKLEISCLVRHGYAVGRKACRARPELFGPDLPGNVPWDPTAARRGPPPPALTGTRLAGPSLEPGAATLEARTLQASSRLRIWSTLLDYRDWTSYVYVPLLIPIFVLLPWFIITSYQRSHRINNLVESLSQGSQDLEQMSYFLNNRPVAWPGEVPEEVLTPEKADGKGFQILQDMRILDLRAWKPALSGQADPTSLVFNYRRLKVAKSPENAGNNLFPVRIFPTSPKTGVRFPQQQLQPRLRMTPLDKSAPDRKEYHFVAAYDFQRVPPGEFVDLVVEYHAPGQFLNRGANSTSLSWDIDADTAELTMWVLLPEGRDYKNFRLLRQKSGSPETLEVVQVVTEYLARDSTILAFKLLSLRAGHTYELTWYYK